MRIAGRDVEITNPERVYFPESGITKGRLVEYYEGIAETMLPHMRDRVVSMHRFPAGIHGHSFFQKAVPAYFPDWVKTVDVEKIEGGTVRSLVCNDAATLVYIANLGCITPHVWLSRIDALNRPDRLIIDLDPSTEDFRLVCETALMLRDLLEELGLTPFVMTTGSRGLHVTAPLDASADFDRSRQFALDVCTLLAQRHPDRLTTEQRIDKRADRLFLDTLRNSYGQTGVAPYAVRAKPGAPVATPLEWKELKKKTLDARSYTIENVSRRLSRIADPWNSIDSARVSLEAARRRLDAASQ